MGYRMEGITCVTEPVPFSNVLAQAVAGYPVDVQIGQSVFLLTPFMDQRCNFVVEYILVRNNSNNINIITSESINSNANTNVAPHNIYTFSFALSIACLDYIIGGV
mgnify:CR=1 FL=1